MDYPKEMCLFLINNKGLIEETSLVEQVENVVFRGINAAIEKKIGQRTPWRSRFALVTGDEEDNDDTYFAPLDWPIKANGEDLVGYRLWESDKDINAYWLAHAFGLSGGTLCLDFWMDGRPCGPSKYKVKQHLETFLAANETLRKAGFHFHERGTLFLPFTLDAAAVAGEYPDLKKSLAPVETVMDTLLKVHTEFDTLVKAFLPHGK